MLVTHTTRTKSAGRSAGRAYLLILILSVAPVLANATDNPPVPIPPTDPLDDQGPECPDRAGAGDPVNVFSGQWFYRKTDLRVPGVFPIELVRQYDGATTYQSALGYGWAYTYDIRLFEFPNDKVVIRSGCGVRHTYSPIYDGMNPDPVGWTTALSRSWNHELTTDPAVEGGYILREPGGERYSFDAEGRLAEIRDQFGNSLEFSYSTNREPLTGTSPYAVDPAVPQVIAHQYQLEEIAEVIAGVPSGRRITFSYDNSTGMLEWAKTHDGRQVDYVHEEIDMGGGVSFSTGNLLSVTDPVGIVQSFTYADPEEPKLAHRVLTFRDGQNTEAHLNYYDPDSLRIWQQAHGRTKIRFHYDPDASQLLDPNDFYTVGRQCGVDVDCRLVERDIVDDKGGNLRTATTLYKYNLAGFLVEMIDAEGNQTIHTYQGALPQSSETYFYDDLLVPPSRVIEKRITYQYDTDGNLELRVLEVDPVDPPDPSPEVVSESWTYIEGRVATHTIASSAAPGREFRTTHAFERAGKAPTDSGYDPEDPITRREVTRLHFDGVGDPGNGDPDETTVYDYNVNGQLQVVTLPDQHKIVQSYYVAADDGIGPGGVPLIRNGLRKEVWHQEGMDEDDHLRAVLDYNAQGLVESTTDARGYQTTYSWDSIGRLVVSENPLGERTLLRYRAPDGASPGQYLYEVEVGQTDLDGEGQVTRSVYDLRGNLREVLRKNDVGQFVTFSETVVDSEGMPVLTIDGEGRSITSSYDLLGRQLSETNLADQTTSYRYDATGDLLQVTDAEGIERIRVYDGLGRLIEVHEPDLDPNAVTGFGYDAAGNRTSVTDANNNTTTYDYDGISRLRMVSRPLLDGSDPVTVLRYDYDLRGRLSDWTNGRGNVVRHEYETWGPLETVRHYADEQAGTAERTITYAYDLAGNILSVSDSPTFTGPLYESATTDYDELNRLLSVELSYLPGSTKSLSYGYDRFGNRTNVTLATIGADSVVQEQEFNALDQLETVTFSTGSPGSSGQLHRFEYLANDNVDRVIHPNGLTTDYEYEAHGPIRNIAVTGEQGAITSLEYSVRDQLDRIETVTETTDVGASAWSYTYDSGDRIDSANYPTNRGLDPAEDFGYDLVGNREKPGDATAWEYDVNDRLLKSPGKTYAYDDDGNVSKVMDGAETACGQSGVACFQFDYVNRMTSYAKEGASSNYLYDPSGRRIGSIGAWGGRWYAWDGERLVAEFDLAGGRTASYAYAGGGLSPIQFEHGAQLLSVHGDHMGTPRALTDPVGQVVWRQAFDAFGQASVDEDPDGNQSHVEFNFRFPGQYFDKGTALYYNRNRMYDPDVGRFISADPIGQAGGINLYQYANSNPVMWSDPFGLQPAPQPPPQPPGEVIPFPRRAPAPKPAPRPGPGPIGPAIVGCIIVLCPTPFGDGTLDAPPGLRDPGDLLGDLPADDECDPKCRDLYAAVRDKAAEVQRRYNDFYADVHELGFDKGHLDRYFSEQAELRLAIAFAEAAGCPVPAAFHELAVRPPPPFNVHGDQYP